MAHAPRSGALNRRLTIQQGAPTSTSEGDAELIWSTLGEVWADIAPASAQELLLAAQRAEEISHLVTIRYQPQFLPPADLRILYGNRLFYISGATDADEAHKMIVLRCKEWVSGAQAGAV